MPIARIVSFEESAPERVAEMKRRIGEEERPEGLPPPRSSCFTTPRPSRRS